MRIRPGDRSLLLLKRFGAGVYDWILTAAILLLALLPWTIAGVDIDHPYHPAMQVYACAIAAFYFVWFWTHGGQTPGMKAWGLRLVGADKDSVGVVDAWLRLFAILLSLFALALLAAVFHPDKRAWYDKRSRCRPIAANV